MNITMLKAKIHRVTVTQAELNYEGSIAIDADLLAASGIRPFEQIHAWNVSNGLRFVTYAMAADAGSGTISVNGSAARSVQVGDILIIAAFASMEDAEASAFLPKLVYVDGRNRFKSSATSIGG
ncbi:MAG: aspartate 1-decarboxylase [Pseudomonadota bacterium]